MRVPAEAKAGDEVQVCRKCRGLGYVDKYQVDCDPYSISHRFVGREDCEHCHGDGLVKERKDEDALQ